MQALSRLSFPLVCFILGLFLFLNMLDSWDSFNTNPIPARLRRCTLSRIFSKTTESTCRFTQRRSRITDTFNPRSYCEQN